MTQNNIKTILPLECPHCKGAIFMEFTSRSPELTASFTIEDIKKAKEDARLRIERLKIDDSKKEEALAWVGDEATVFGPGEVDEILNSLIG